MAKFDSCKIRLIWSCMFLLNALLWALIVELFRMML